MKWLIREFREWVGFALVNLRFLFRVNEKEILSLYFHDPSKVLFDRIAMWLIRNHYRFISVGQLENLIATGKTDKKLAVLTFDDAWKGNLALVDSFERFRIPVTIFVPVEPVREGNYWWEYASQEGQETYSGMGSKEDFKKLSGEVFMEKIAILKKNYTLERTCMTLEELGDLSKNKWITIGSHTVTHPILNNLALPIQESELRESKQILNSWLQQPIDYLAYPNGDFDEHTIAMAQKCKYKLAFSIHPATINVHKVDPFQIPRYAINDKGGYYENLAKVLGIWQKIFG